AEQTQAGQPQAGDVEIALGTERLIEPEEAEDDGDDADRHVEPEDPMPGDALGDRAADERADRDGKPADTAPGAERDRTSLGRNTGREDRQGEWGHDRAADALRRPGEDQDVTRRRERGHGRTDREDREADDEHPPAP